MEAVQLYLHQAQRKGQGPKILSHQFCLCQSLVHFSLCPIWQESLCSWLCSGWCCIAVSRSALTAAFGSHLVARPALEAALGACAWATWLLDLHGAREREWTDLNERTRAIQWEVFVKLWLYYLRLLSWLIASPILIGLVIGRPPNQPSIFPVLNTSPLWSLCWLLLHLCPAEGFPCYFTPPSVIQTND